MKKNTLTLADMEKMYRIFDAAVNNGSTLDDEDIRTAIIIKTDDISGSMREHEETMYDATMQTLQELGKRNENATEVCYKWMQIFFNDKTTVFNEELMAPEDLMHLITPKNFDCRNSTNLGGIFKLWLDLFHTNSPMMTKIAASGIKPVILLTTDFEGNHNTALEKQYIQEFKNNRLIRDYVQILCVYVGNESRKHVVEDLFGADNVVPLTKDLSKHLANTLINSTVNLVDGTRIESKEQTAREIAEKEKSNSESSAAALGAMSYEEAKKYMNNLFGCAS